MQADAHAVDADGAAVDDAAVHSVGEDAYPCVYRKLKHGRSGDEVRPGWRVNESHRFAEPGEKPAHPCSRKDVF